MTPWPLRFVTTFCGKTDCVPDLDSLRRFLLSLKRREFSCQVGNLVKCRTEDEFNSLKQIYEEEFRSIMDPDRMRLLEKTLGKTGLNYNEGTIVIEGDGVHMEASESAHAEHNEHARRNAWTP
jgi:hypothetical protein